MGLQQQSNREYYKGVVDYTNESYTGGRTTIKTNFNTDLVAKNFVSEPWGREYVNWNDPESNFKIKYSNPLTGSFEDYKLSNVYTDGNIIFLEDDKFSLSGVGSLNNTGAGYTTGTGYITTSDATSYVNNVGNTIVTDDNIEHIATVSIDSISQGGAIAGVTLTGINSSSGLSGLGYEVGKVYKIYQPGQTGTQAEINVIPHVPNSIYYQVLIDEAEKENNYGSYAYVPLKDIINGFIVGYVGEGKLISKASRNDIIFHAKRGLQEFSYDVLKSVKSQELTIPPSLSLVIPPDYVNYVRVSYIDEIGVKRIINPTTLTSNPYQSPIQDADGVPTSNDYFGLPFEGTSLTEERWDDADMMKIKGLASAQRYGLTPENSFKNGWFTINERKGLFSFSSDLAGKLIVLEYVTDGLAYDLDTKVPKLAEDAMYAHISYSILANRSKEPEYVIRRLKKDRSSKIRNAKIRLSNVKIGEIAQVMRNKSKQIKH